MTLQQAIQKARANSRTRHPLEINKVIDKSPDRDRQSSHSIFIHLTEVRDRYLSTLFNP